MFSARKRLTATAFLAFSIASARAEESSTRPAKDYGPNDVTAYISVDLDGFMKSKFLAAVSPESARGIEPAKAEIRRASKEQLGVDIGDAWISSANVMIFGNDKNEAAAVVRGTWTAEQVNALIASVSKVTGETPVTVSYHGHDVIDLKVDSDVNLSVGAKGVTAKATAKSKEDGGDHPDQAFVSVHAKGPVVVAATLASATRALDALDADQVAGEGKIV